LPGQRCTAFRRQKAGRGRPVAQKTGNRGYCTA